MNSFLLLNDVMLHFRWKVPGVMDGDEPRSFVTLYEFEGYIYMPFFLYGISFSFNYCFLSTVLIDGLFITVHGIFF